MKTKLREKEVSVTMSTNVKTLHFPLYLLTDRDTVTVVGYIDGFDYFSVAVAKELEDGKGYLNYEDDMVYIYKDSKPQYPSKAPYFWIDGDRFVHSKPITSIMSQYRKANLEILTEEQVRLATQSMPKKTYDLDEEWTDLSSKSSEKLLPIIRPVDDFLKKTIKTALNCLQIPLQMYKSKTAQKYQLSNMKQALLSSTKMSSKYYNQWTEVLGLDTVMIVSSNDTAMKPLTEPLIYVSTMDTTYTKTEWENMGYEFPDVFNKKKKE